MASRLDHLLSRVKHVVENREDNQYRVEADEKGNPENGYQERGHQLARFVQRNPIFDVLVEYKAEERDGNYSKHGVEDDSPGTRKSLIEKLYGDMSFYGCDIRQTAGDDDDAADTDDIVGADNAGDEYNEDDVD